MKFKCFLVTAVFAVASLACAQTAAPAAPPAPIQTGYAGGISYNPGADKPVAGTGLFFHAIAGSNTYAFSAVDAVPATLKPFTISTNVGVGVAQKVARIGGIDVFAPVATGVEFTGQNVGWQWNGGALAVIPIKNSRYFVAPNLRFLKGSVTSGSGYQVIAGVLFGFGT
jgi:hypothetical protein